MKFIVVDDNKTFREGIKYYLENPDFKKECKKQLHY